MSRKDDETLPLVAVVTDVKEIDGYRWHATPQQYLRAARYGARVQPLMVPAFGSDSELDAILDAVDGLLVTGSRSNVHPERYGGEPTEAHMPFDPDRDSTSLPLIRRAIERGIPLFAICRGIQELNVALGGTLATEIQELEGRADHRAPVSDDNDERFRIRHPVIVSDDSCLGSVLHAGPVHVNSLHRQAIDRLADGLTAEALAEDGTVEAVSVDGAKAFAIGVQWHPEYWYEKDPASAKLFEAFGDAVRKHRAGRGQA